MTSSPYITISETDLRAVAVAAVDHARHLGIASARASATADGGVTVSVQNGRAETARRDGRQTLMISLFDGGRTGNVTTADLQLDAVRRAVEEAAAIVRFVQPDDQSGLAERDWLAWTTPAPLMHDPDHRDAAALVDEAAAIENAARDAAADSGVRISEAGVTTREGLSILALSEGLCRSRHWSSHGRWCLAVASDAHGNVSDAAQTSQRRRRSLDPIDTVARLAVERTLAARAPRTAGRGGDLVMIDARVAADFLGDFVGALGGQAQVSRSSFLLDSLGHRVLADDLDLVEDPFEPFGPASGAYDEEGVEPRQRFVVRGGVAEGYFLDSRSARRLGMRSSGNADGPYNLTLTSAVPGGDAAAMRRRLGRGLIVTQFEGGQTDPLTGSFSKAVSGFWVEDGEIAWPVHNVTIAGRLTDALRRIVAVGDDVQQYGPFRAGSLLIEGMHVGGGA